MMTPTETKMEQETPSTDVSEIDEPAEIINSDSGRVAVNEEMCELFEKSEDELMSLTVWETNNENTAEAGRDFQKALEGETITADIEVECEEDGPKLVTAKLEPVEMGGETHVLSTIKDIREVETPTVMKEPDASVFEDISPEELDEIVQNIRVDAPEGKMNLGAIMLDLAAGHNEIEQYKKGALSLHQAIDERLEEEEKRNPDSKEVDLLREVKRSAFGLYLRIQRGDEELHGERDGRYSGYFD